jgi:hypothetical protein
VFDAGTFSAQGVGLPDSGASFASACDAVGGTLEPGTRSCFSIVSTPALSWQNALLACQDWGGTLAKIDAAAEDDFLTAETSVNSWIGARDPAASSPTSRNFRWVSDETLIDDQAYANWAPLEPDATAGQFCIEKYQEPPNDPWYDQPCNDQRGYICQQDL